MIVTRDLLRGEHPDGGGGDVRAALIPEVRVVPSSGGFKSKRFPPLYRRGCVIAVDSNPLSRNQCRPHTVFKQFKGGDCTPVLNTSSFLHSSLSRFDLAVLSLPSLVSRCLLAVSSSSTLEVASRSSRCSFLRSALSSSSARSAVSEAVL